MASSSQVRASRREQLKSQRLADAQKDRRSKIIMVAAAVVVLGLIIGVSFWGWYSAQANKGGNEQPPNANAAGNGIQAHPNWAGVPTLEIFSDYNCTHCRSADIVLGPLIDQLATDGQLNVIHHTTAGMAATSFDAARAAACADFQNLFLEYHHQLFRNQEEGFDYTMINQTIPESIDLTGVALEEFRTCVATGATAGFITATNRYAQKQGVTSTPSFFLDGVDVTEKLYSKTLNRYDPDLLRELLGLN
ncbi:MAG: DsbA family protein [Propionibacteriaceae bacterium]|jgi:hypothetical protein|nr:DsbA family protein [Propionibacteriaceae bacterium]